MHHSSMLHLLAQIHILCSNQNRTNLAAWSTTIKSGGNSGTSRSSTIRGDRLKKLVSSTIYFRSSLIFDNKEQTVAAGIDRSSPSRLAPSRLSWLSMPMILILRLLMKAIPLRAYETGDSVVRCVDRLRPQCIRLASAETDLTVLQW